MVPFTSGNQLSMRNPATRCVASDVMVSIMGDTRAGSLLNAPYASQERAAPTCQPADERFEIVDCRQRLIAALAALIAGLVSILAAIA
jgi:hypothetical protein